MLRNAVLALAATAAFTANAAAQFCSDNTYKLWLVTATGAPLPTAFDPVVQETTYRAANENVYLAFDPLIPSGTYYVHVTDNPINGQDEVLSQNDPMDRFVSVVNTNGVITLSLPFTNNNTPAVFGQGLNGQGMSNPPVTVLGADVLGVPLQGLVRRQLEPDRRPDQSLPARRRPAPADQPVLDPLVRRLHDRRRQRQ
jgi:hypothetical protein